MTHLNKLLIVFVLAVLTACGEKDYLVTITTPYGDMHAVLYDDTPLHKENFIKLTKQGFYDSLLFHRVIENFMIQGGDPDSKGAGPGTAIGSGGPGYTIPAEIRKNHFHKRGALSAARLGDNQNPKKASSGSQFYIVQGEKYTKNELTTDMQALGMAGRQAMDENDSIKQMLIDIYETQGPEAYGDKLMEMKKYLSDLTGQDFSQNILPERVEAYTTIGGVPHLDDQYTVFGEVIDGLDVIDKVASQPVDGKDRPIDDIPFTISVEEVYKKKITKDYGYEFPVKE